MTLWLPRPRFEEKPESSSSNAVDDDAAAGRPLGSGGVSEIPTPSAAAFISRDCPAGDDWRNVPVGACARNKVERCLLGVSAWLRGRAKTSAKW